MIDHCEQNQQKQNKKIHESKTTPEICNKVEIIIGRKILWFLKVNKGEKIDYLQMTRYSSEKGFS